MTSQYDKDLYFVAVKVFIQNNRGELLIIKDRFGDWDLPGGRLRENDFLTPFEKIIIRKIKEELGAKIKYNLRPCNITMRHERNEILVSNKREKRRIFAVSYIAEYLGGNVDLGKNHTEYKWVNLKTLKPEKYFTGGWLKGLREYIKISRND